MNIMHTRVPHICPPEALTVPAASLDIYIMYAPLELPPRPYLQQLQTWDQAHVPNSTLPSMFLAYAGKLHITCQLDGSIHCQEITWEEIATQSNTWQAELVLEKPSDRSVYLPTNGPPPSIFSQPHGHSPRATLTCSHNGDTVNPSIENFFLAYRKE